MDVFVYFSLINVALTSELSARMVEIIASDFSE